MRVSGTILLLLSISAIGSPNQDPLHTKLYATIKKSEGNVIFSPLGIESLLAILYQGTGGSTLNLFANSLRLPDPLTAAQHYKSALRRLNEISNVTLVVANKVYIKQNKRIKSAFGQVIRNNFDAEIDPINFVAYDAATIINKWVSMKTNQKINELVSPGDLNVNTRLLLLNAIYFKGSWTHRFNVRDTSFKTFYISSEQAVDVPMMSLREDLLYAENEFLDAKIVELPYANGDISMVIILPNQLNGIRKLDEKLLNYDFKSILQNVRTTLVYLYLPKFKIEYEIDLKHMLESLNLGDIFTSRADLSNLLEDDEPLTVSKAVQKAFIEVNEEGTEASGASGTKVQSKKRKTTMNANHPFVFLIRVRHGPILFVGQVTNPNPEAQTYRIDISTKSNSVLLGVLQRYQQLINEAGRQKGRKDYFPRS